MNSPRWFLRIATWSIALAASVAAAAPIPGLFHTGVGTGGALLVSGSIDPHWRLVQSADPGFQGPNAIVLNDVGFPINPWIANGPSSKWLAPQASQATGNAVGDYTYRIVFDLTGLEPATAVITGRWTSDNTGPEVRLNGVPTGAISDGNFGGFNNNFTFNSGFIDGTNTLEFVVNNACCGVNPTGFRCEFLSGTADPLLPPGTPPSITRQPVSRTTGLGDSASFTVSALGSRPLFYQWRFNGAPIPNETNSILAINNATAANQGSYDVVVNNASGSTNSVSVTLNVLLRIGPSSRRTGLAFTEIMYHPTNRADGRSLEFIELHNSNPFAEDISGWRISGAIDYVFPLNTVLPGDGFLLVAPAPADVQAAYGVNGVLGGFTNALGVATNNLPNEGGTLRLRKKSGAIVLEVTYSDQPPWPAAADGSGHSLVLREPTWGENNARAWAASGRKGGSPAASDFPASGPLESVVLNEVLAHTDLPALDYVELHNHSTNTVEVAGCWLSDDPATNKFRIDPGVTIAPGGFLAFDETQLGFRLAADGETVYFINAANTRVVDSLRFGGQANGVSYGRWPDGAPAFHELSMPTRGMANAPPLVRDVVINEIMFNPISDNNDDEFVELHNQGALPVNLGGWRLLDGIGFTFPPNTMIPSGGYLVVANNASRLRTNYPGLSAANVVGNYSGNLANGGERVALAMPDSSFTTNGGVITTNLFYIVMDEVTYADGGRWTRWADGGGSSLELIDPRADNRLAPNWADSASPAATNWTIVAHTGVLDLGSGAASELDVMLQGPGEALVDDIELIPSGGGNRISNPGLETGITGWRLQGTHAKSYWETTAGYNSARSLHLVATDRGDHLANHLRTTLTSALTAGQSATIRAKVRWLRGHPEILFRIKGGYLEAVGRLTLPANLGTPGARNSRAASNAGPAITDVLHSPILPPAGAPILVTARLSDPDGVGGATLKYRLDPSATLNSVAMTDDGLNGDAWPGDRILTGAIPAQSAGTLIAFRVEARDGFSPAATNQFPADAPTRECLVRVGETSPGGAFGAYRFWITQAGVNFWAGREKMSNEDVDTTFVYGNTRVVYNAGTHYSGSSYTIGCYNSPVGSLCGYDLNLPDDDAVLGETHLTLDFLIRDDTGQREQLQYWFLDQAGVPNMYRRYVHCIVNGVPQTARAGGCGGYNAIYEDVQQPAGDAIDSWFSDDSGGSLYKTDCWDEFDNSGNRETSCISLNTLQLFTTTGGVKKTARYRWNWRPRAVRGTANDFTDLFNLVDAANATSNGYPSAVECLVDIEHWARTFAVNDLSSFWDAFGNRNGKNTYLYKPERDGWKLFCWDFDVGLGVFADPVDNPLFDANDPMVARMIPQTPGWTRLYWATLQESLSTFFNTGAGMGLDAVLDGKYAAFQANGIALSSPAGIKTWISQRRSFLQGQLASVAANFTVAGPVSFSTNANLVTLTGTAPVGVRTLVVNGVAYPITWTSVTAWRLTVPIVAGANTLAIQGLDRFGNVVSGASRTNTVTYTGADERPENSIVINEIMYNPVMPEASYVELFNRSANYAFDLSGWRLNGLGFTLPYGAIISPRGFLVLAKNRAAFGTAYGWGIPVFCEFDGQLDDGGETLSLIKPGATPAQDMLVDIVTYDDDPPWLATPDGQGASLQLRDPAQDNNRVANWSDGSGWRFFSYTNGVGSSQLTRLSWFFENAGGDIYIDDVSLVIGNVPGVGVNVLSNGGFETPLTPPWFRGPVATNTEITTALAHSGVASLHLVNAPTTAPSLTTFYQDFPALTAGSNYTFSFWYQPGNSGTNLSIRLNSLFLARLNPGSIRTSVTPGAANAVPATLPPFPPLWLSEVQPINTSTIADNFDDFDPWIELHNSGDAPLNLDGFALSSGYANLAEWFFPNGTVIGGGERLLVWADAESGQTAGTNLHANFRLHPTNGAVVLTREVAGSRQILDYLNYAGVGTNRSFGSYPDGQLSFRQSFYYPTPGRTNDPSAAPVTLFINEWMAANVSFVRDPADLDYDDWFEIYNPTANAVDLAGFTLTDNPASPRKFVVPAGITVPPIGFLLVWADENTSQTSPDGDLHVNFRLSQNGEDIVLHDPAGRQIDAVHYEMQTNDVSQGRWPDGAAALHFMTTPTPRARNVLTYVTPDLEPPTLGPGNTVNFSWSAQPGSFYQVQYKDELDELMWHDLGPPTMATGSTASANDTLTAPQRFYRILLVQ